MKDYQEDTSGHGRQRREASRNGYSRKTSQPNKTSRKQIRNRKAGSNAKQVNFVSKMSDNANHENSRYREDQQNLQLNVLVAVDNVITEHHKNLTDVTHGLKAYITSLIHLVDNIFQHDTLDRRLRIHLLGIHEFTKEESNLIIYENAPNETLNAVCDLLADPKLEPRYSTQDQKGTADHKDISIFLTRRRFGPAGRNT